jgi:hypothetical protein
MVVMSVVPPMPAVPRPVGIFVVIALIDAEHAFHATDRAADGGADNSADRPRDATTFIETVGSTSRNATFGLCGGGHRQRRETCSANQEFHSHLSFPLVSRHATRH